jgi:glycosyltransferase involved in cell wall biosynthesis
MKILHVNTEKGWRGGEQQLFYLVRGLKERGIKTAVACKVGDELFKRCRENGIEVIPLKGNQTTDIFRIGYLGRNFDLIHAHSSKGHAISVLSKKFHKKPVIYTRRIDYPPKKNPLSLIKYSLTDVVVAVSHNVAKVLKEKTNIDHRRIKVIHSVTSEEIEKNVNQTVTENFRKQFDEKLIVGTASALTEQKNIPNLINAAEIVIKEIPNVVFVVLGKGKLRKKIEKIIKEKNLEDKFKLLGFKKNVQDYIKGFDVFVISSDNEGFCGSILHAMMLKVPVVSTDAGGVKEVVENFKTGIVVEKRNPQKLAEGIITLLKNKELRESIVEEAYRKVKLKFTVPVMVNSYVELYREVLGDKRKL